MVSSISVFKRHKIILNITFIFICFIILTITCANAKKTSDTGDLFPVKIHDKFGFIDRTGKVVIEPQFDIAPVDLVALSSLFRFTEGLAPVRIGSVYDHWQYQNRKDRIGYIDKTGKLVIGASFDEAGDFSEGLAPVSVEGRYGYIDHSGKFVIAPSFKDAESFSEGLALVRLGLYIYIDRNIDNSGKFAIKSPFKNAMSFSEGLAPVDLTFPYTDGSSPDPTSDTEKWGYVNREGKVVIAPIYSKAIRFSEGLAAVRSGNKWGYINKAGHFVIQPQFDGAFAFSEGLAVVGYGRQCDRDYGDDCKYGYIDSRGKTIIAPKFIVASDFSEGMASVSALEKKRLQGYIDRTGKLVIPYHGQSFFNGLAYITTGMTKNGTANAWAYINKQGKFVWKSTDEERSRAQTPGPYIFRSFFNNGGSFEILQDGKVLYSHSEGGWIFNALSVHDNVSLSQFFGNGNNTWVLVGNFINDITGDGIPKLVVQDYPGGNRGVCEYLIFTLGNSLKKISWFEASCMYPFKDIKNNILKK